LKMATSQALIAVSLFLSDALRAHTMK